MEDVMVEEKVKNSFRDLLYDPIVGYDPQRSRFTVKFTEGTCIYGAGGRIMLFGSPIKQVTKIAIAYGNVYGTP